MRCSAAGCANLLHLDEAAAPTQADSRHFFRAAVSGADSLQVGMEPPAAGVACSRQRIDWLRMRHGHALMHRIEAVVHGFAIAGWCLACARMSTEAVCWPGSVVGNRCACTNNKRGALTAAGLDWLLIAIRICMQQNIHKCHGVVGRGRGMFCKSSVIVDIVNDM